MLNKLFDRYQVGKRFSKKITGFEPGSVVFEDESKLEADLILFIPASAGHSVLQASDLPLTEAGFIQIDNFCQVRGLPDVYAIGDIAAIEGPEWIAKQGHIAELMGRNAAHNIIESEKGTSNKKGYQEHLNILCVMDTGDGAAFVFRNSQKSFFNPDACCWPLDEKGLGNLFEINQGRQISTFARNVKLQNKKMRKVLKKLVRNRMVILTILGVSLYLGISQYHISLWYILFYGIFLGVIFGKVFCRWVCPMGLIMEMMMSMGGEDSKIKQMYQYHKIGCPIAWISGLAKQIFNFQD